MSVSIEETSPEVYFQNLVLTLNPYGKGNSKVL
jgi:hypothetical protein